MKLQEHIPNSVIILVALVTVYLLFLYSPPEASCPVNAAEETTLEGEPAKAPPSLAQVKVAITTSASTIEDTETAQENGPFEMPYFEGIPVKPREYIGLVLDRGGTLLVAQGAKLLPVGIALLKNGRLRVEPLGKNFVLPSLIARDVTIHTRQMLTETLEGNSRILLLWPDSMQNQLQQQLQKLPVSTNHLKATYQVVGNKLHINLTETKKGGEWHAIDYTIVI